MWLGCALSGLHKAGASYSGACVQCTFLSRWGEHDLEFWGWYGPAACMHMCVCPLFGDTHTYRMQCPLRYVCLHASITSSSLAQLEVWVLMPQCTAAGNCLRLYTVVARLKFSSLRHGVELWLRVLGCWGWCHGLRVCNGC